MLETARNRKSIYVSISEDDREFQTLTLKNEDDTNKVRPDNDKETDGKLFNSSQSDIKHDIVKSLIPADHHAEGIQNLPTIDNQYSDNEEDKDLQTFVCSSHHKDVLKQRKLFITKIKDKLLSLFFVVYNNILVTLIY